MAYRNDYFYNRDSSVDKKYSYVNDLSIYKPIYGSSVDFISRLNFLETVDNSLKILPSSENNLTANYNFIFLLNDQELGKMLRTIEVAGGYRHLKFTDPSGLYKDIVGLVEDYSISKTTSSLNELKITLSSYIKSPIFTWKTSSFLNVKSNELDLDTNNKTYKKYQFIFYKPSDLSTNKVKVHDSNNQMDYFWFATKDFTMTANSFLQWKDLWTRKFIYETKMPFNLENKFDVYRLEYKNSFIQNIKHKDNSNSLKSHEVRFENLDDFTCKSILFFLEKKCGYRRFMYDFPIFLNQKKVFICVRWTHIFKYKDSNDITATFIEDPNPNIVINTTDNYHELA
jgi:phage-related protein